MATNVQGNDFVIMVFEPNSGSEPPDKMVLRQVGRW